ncbi:MAG: UGMP family protein [Thermoproteota archaeon]|uniref:tRNA N6-adenosine threonylcarbamoyltransferase n=1 Tax=Candidatus Methanodesulfokora washburnensis TaxID=2478471 RepID=A0A3R9QH02_9CREN|nr:KEOPS complex N(6)-L-threonylcarbamoyladenine synthase Kae1 [Candidatus Methanodesulfokores washburnensis]RSN76308.1 tRNA (adenosine(37)-N6)-threonylcarbamoyltransferase complex transferase subunit TsaD [Candidatus Methanodesulfokores washburnensis]RZN60573.1 MAG: tRNA (adenosine(37)-N6)-threonylcarbamoyltransferase complex transferase subunit TsaD [Candidatus Methanodesulfokores washburnensis]TDA41242.1 MAG: UGMP family protein [Candidatus Korarchaeota archaeon]
MIAMGIESTAHTFGVGIADERGRILANEMSSYSSEKGGMRPFDVAEHHAKRAAETIKRALNKASISMKDLDIIGFSQGPGIWQALSVGASIARALSKLLEIPLIGVNHPIAHVEIGRLLTRARDPVVVYISGGNTQILTHASDRYVVMGETLDIGFGNAQEKLGRIVGLGFPAGPEMDRIIGNWVDLPYTVKGMDLAFSGILTEAERLIKSGLRKEDVIWSFVEVCTSMIAEVAERALAHTGKNELLLVGGVAASPRLQEKMRIMCEERNAVLKVPPAEFSRDNGAMIAWTAILSFKYGGALSIEESSIKPYWRIDDVQWPLMDLPDS